MTARKRNPLPPPPYGRESYYDDMALAAALPMIGRLPREVAQLIVFLLRPEIERMRETGKAIDAELEKRAAEKEAR